MGLRIVHVTVPSAIESGKNAVLVCEHDLETDTLYSVKWYKGRREFFRYTPKEIPAVKVFPLPGITVDVSIWVRIRTIKKLLFLYYLISCVYTKRIKYRLYPKPEKKNIENISAYNFNNVRSIKKKQI